MELPSGIYALAGLAHMDTDEGRLLSFRRDGTHWLIDTAATLASAPYAFARLGGDSLLVATPKGVLAIVAPHTAVTLASASTWWLTYPHSIVRDRAGNIFVGMRFAVAKLSAAHSYQETWLVPGGVPCESAFPERPEVSPALPGPGP